MGNENVEITLILVQNMFRITLSMLPKKQTFPFCRKSLIIFLRLYINITPTQQQKETTL